MKVENSTTSYISRYTDEDEAFWKNHISKFNVSELSRKLYCTQNALNYPRFSYWITKLSPKKSHVVSEKLPKNEIPKKLLPVQLKPETKISEGAIPLSLELKNGYTLNIHDGEGLLIVLDKML